MYPILTTVARVSKAFTPSKVGTHPREWRGNKIQSFPRGNKFYFLMLNSKIKILRIKVGNSWSDGCVKNPHQITHDGV